MLVELVNTYHGRFATTWGRVGSRRENRASGVDSCDPLRIYNHPQHRQLAVVHLPMHQSNLVRLEKAKSVRGQ